MAEEKHKGGGGNAFVFGVVMGTTLTLLLTTKKGRKIMREISDHGLDALEKFLSMEPLEDEVDETMDEQDMPVENEADSTKENSSHTPAPRRRFFRGTKKR